MLLAFASAGCATQPPLESAIIANPYVNYLAGAGYTPFVMPSTLQSAGALVSIDPAGLPVVKGDLKNCGMTDSDLYGSDPTKANAYQNGKFPNFTGVGENDFGLAVVAAIKGVSGSVGASDIRKVTIEVTDVGEETLNALRVKSFLTNPTKLASLDPICRSEIASGNVAIITQSAYIQSGKITFYGKDDYSLKLDQAAVIKALNLDVKPSATFKVSRDGTLTFNSRMYVAFKIAYQYKRGGPLLSKRKGRWADASKGLAASLNH